MITYTAKCDICGAENTVPSYGDWRCKQCGQGYEYDECHRISLTAAQWALLRNPPKWIPASERLPDEEQDVLAYWPSSGLDDDDPWMTVARVFEGEKWRDMEMELQPPTHWMPLHEPPEVK